MRVSYGALVFAFLVLPTIARPQAFSQIAITPSVSADTRESHLQILPSGDLIGHSVPIIELLSLAYDVPDNPSPRLSSLPEWTARQRFDIEAKVPASLELTSKDVATQKQTIQQLVRKLLADRFGLVLHVRTEQMAVYALFVAEGQQKLHPVAEGDCILDTSPKGCHTFAPGFGHPLNAKAVDMSDVAHYLGNWTDLPVVNRTALTGLFTLHSEGWKPMNLPPPPPGTAASGDEFASLPPLSVVLSSIGLQLRRQEENLPLYTVERIHPPNAR